MRNGFARAVYIVIATKDGQTEFWAAATARTRAATAVQELAAPGWRVTFLGWRLNPAKAVALKMLPGSVRKLIGSAAIDSGLLRAP
ncbi:MAG TPA: hypothetical protein VMF32_09475 [Xanthobacteraceae bacterium]|nr:hypothetical protein [Xanthobacteraceae bacterium]